MAFAPIREAFIKMLGGVKGIGKIHNRKRHETFWDGFFRTVDKNGKLNTWEVSRKELVVTVAAVGGTENNPPCLQDNHTLLLVGRMALSDEKESEPEFDALMDAIVRAQALNDRLDGTYLQPAFMQIGLREERSYGSVLVHYCEMTLECRRREGIGNG